MAMNRQEAMELERAIDRAAHDQIYIMGRGTRRSDGARVFVVSSAKDTNRGYIVVVHAGHLVCECPSRKVCKHRALVHLELKREREEEAAHVAAMTAAERARAEVAADLAEDEDDLGEGEEYLCIPTAAGLAAHRAAQVAAAQWDERETAMLASRADNRPFSMWK